MCPVSTLPSRSPPSSPRSSLERGTWLHLFLRRGTKATWWGHISSQVPDRTLFFLLVFSFFLKCFLPPLPTLLYSTILFSATEHMHQYWIPGTIHLFLCSTGILHWDVKDIKIACRGYEILNLLGLIVKGWVQVELVQWTFLCFLL